MRAANISLTVRFKKKKKSARMDPVVRRDSSEGSSMSDRNSHSQSSVHRCLQEVSAVVSHAVRPNSDAVCVWVCLDSVTRIPIASARKPRTQQAFYEKPFTLALRHCAFSSTSAPSWPAQVGPRKPLLAAVRHWHRPQQKSSEHQGFGVSSCMHTLRPRGILGG